MSLLFVEQGLQNNIQFLKAAVYRLQETISNFSYYNETSIPDDGLKAAMEALKVAMVALENQRTALKASEQYLKEFDEGYLTSLPGDLFSERQSSVKKT